MEGPSFSAGAVTPTDLQHSVWLQATGADVHNTGKEHCIHVRRKGLEDQSFGRLGLKGLDHLPGAGIQVGAGERGPRPHKFKGCIGIKDGRHGCS